MRKSSNRIATVLLFLVAVCAILPHMPKQASAARVLLIIGGLAALAIVIGGNLVPK